VATAIPYVNDVPHCGHALEAIVADVVARYQVQAGKQVFFSYGTDEHGGKIAEKAAEKGVSVERYVDDISQSFVDLANLLHVKYSKFIRTTDADHIKRAQYIWSQLKDDIYKSTYKGMYDQKEETFITTEEARKIEKSDPERFKRLQSLEEENYYFRLSKYNERILDAIKSDQMKVMPRTRRNEIINMLEGGLTDASISRPNDKIDWAIPVPGDDSQNMYVWFEALMNYITTLGYPDGRDFATHWPCDLHVIGKDINRFHSIIWPAMLLGLGLELPKAIYVHGMVTFDGHVMSKTLGNVVAPKEIVSAYGADATRYYFLRHIPSNEDGDFTWKKFEAAYNGELGNELGNLVQRVASMINRYQDGLIGDIPSSKHDTGPYHDAFEEYRFDKALDYTWTLVRGLNQYVDAEQPWELAKSDPEHLKEVLAYATSSILQIADMIAPFMPITSTKIIKTFGEGVIKDYDGPLFPKIYNYTEPRKI
jgi:methionyl-tRNA synthetase